MIDLNRYLLQPTEDFVIDQPTGNIGAMQWQSEFMRELKEYGIDIHYELHYNDGDSHNLIRICCHVHPYHEFSNGAHNTKEQFLASLRARYDEERVQKILSFRDAIKDAYMEFGRSYTGELDYHKRKDIDYLDLVCKPLAHTLNDEELISDIYSFIGQTYSMLINTINLNVNLLK